MGNEPKGRCGVCRCYMDSDDLFCPNCGTENPLAQRSQPKLKHAQAFHSFACLSCGASMSYDASAKALRCPFCGSTQMEKKKSHRTIVPSGVVPFRINRERAEEVLRRWLGSGFWRPSDAARASQIGEIASVYVPYWVFEAVTDTRWTADSSPAPLGSRGDWYPLSGTQASNYPNVLVGGSSILTPHETDSIAPFAMDKQVDVGDADLDNFIVEDFRVPRKSARPMARGAIEHLERQACAAQVPNRSRNVRVNVQFSSMCGYPMLLPVWILAYRYKKNVHRVLINGQSGKIAGSAPFSYRKLAAVVGIAVAILVVILIIVFLANQ